MHSSVETKDSWTVAAVALIAMLMAFGGAWITPVALKEMPAESGGIRSVPALATAIAWLGNGFGGILMGRIADRIGARRGVMFGACMVAPGLVWSALGPP